MKLVKPEEKKEPIKSTRDLTEPTIEEFLLMFGGQVPESGQEAKEPTNIEPINTPIELLTRLYPFMLSERFSACSDLCLLGNCSEVEIDQMVKTFLSII